MPSRRRDRAADLELALVLADIGSRLAFRRFAHGHLHVVEKAGGNLVSDADMAAESEIRHRLEVVRPEDGVLGEEFGAEGNQHARWIIDPINGTDNFISKDSSWAVMVALEVHRRVEVGVVDAPALGRRWWAARGLGAYADGRRLRASDSRTSLGGARLTPRGRRHLDRLPAEHPLVAALSHTSTPGRDLAWAELLLAEDAADIDLSAGGRLWELAATRVILSESGCRVSDLDRSEPVHSGTTLAATPELHRQLLDLLGASPSAPGLRRRQTRPRLAVLS